MLMRRKMGILSKIYLEFQTTCSVCHLEVKASVEIRCLMDWKLHPKRVEVLYCFHSSIFFFFCIKDELVSTLHSTS